MNLYYILFYFIFLISACRSAAVDSTGIEFNRNRLIALMSAIVLEEVRFSSYCIKDLDSQL